MKACYHTYDVVGCPHCKPPTIWDRMFPQPAPATFGGGLGCITNAILPDNYATKRWRGERALDEAFERAWTP